MRKLPPRPVIPVLAEDLGVPRRRERDPDLAYVPRPHPRPDHESSSNTPPED